MLIQHIQAKDVLSVVVFITPEIETTHAPVASVSIIYAIFVYLLPEHSKKVHNKTNTTLKRILLIFLSFLWIGTILFTLFSYVSSAYLVLGIFAAYAFPFLLLISSFYYLAGNHL